MPQLLDSDFATLLGRESHSLTGFLVALVGDVELAADLYQSTCLELWRIRRTFQAGTNFGAWARTVARFQVLRHYKRKRGEKLVFSSEAMERITDAYEESRHATYGDELRAALARCLASLPEESRKLLEQRYSDGTSVRRLATAAGLSEGGLKMRLVRARQRLAGCIRSKMSREAAPHEG